MWPLALLHPLVHSSIVLLVRPGRGPVRHVVRRPGLGPGRWLGGSTVGDAWAAAVLGGTALLLVVNPVLYATATEDFHFEPLATLLRGVGRLRPVVGPDGPHVGVERCSASCAATWAGSTWSAWD